MLLKLFNQNRHVFSFAEITEIKTFFVLILVEDVLGSELVTKWVVFN